jgi:hypothetical protein
MDARIEELARTCCLDAGDLRAAAAQLPVPGEEQLRRTTRLLQLTAGTMAEMGRERLHLLGRLRRIAEMTILDE